MKQKRSLRRARQLAVASTAGLALLTALAGSAGTAAADTAPTGTPTAMYHAWTPGWKAVLSGSTAGDELLSVTSVDADHAWAAGRGTDGHGLLMRWDGQTWSRITDAALPRVERWSSISAAAADDVWAYGSVTTATDGTQYLVHYDGKQWSAVPTTGAFDRDFLEVPIRAVPGRLFKGGNALYTYTDGDWQTFALPEGVDIQSIDALSADDAYATGMKFPVNGGHPVVYHWDGTTWTLMPQPPSPADISVDEITVESPDSLYVGGFGYLPSGALDTRVLHWDGSTWKDVTGDLSEFVLESLRSDGHGGVWAAGSDGWPSSAPVFWHYDGTTWKRQFGTPLSGEDHPSFIFNDIASIDGSAGSRFLAVGSSMEGGVIEETQSSLDLATADLHGSSTAPHTVRVHAETPGRLTVAFRPADGQPDWSTSTVDVTVASVSGGPQGACDHATGPVNGAAAAVTCDLPAGDHTIGYTLAAGASVAAWQVVADAHFQASDAGEASPEVTAGFAVVPVATRFLGRDTAGTLWRYDGTGNASAPYQARVAVGSGWQGYTALTALSTLTVHGTGDVVARDASGVLWYYRGGGDARPFAARVKVGAGWNAYNSLVGAGDLTGDGRADLLARDASGVLWLYPGTPSTTAPFGARAKVGTGWGIYNALLVPGDLTGDGRADIVGRDAWGVLWLYRGTGDAAAPYAARVNVGTGWGAYNALI
jgi:hypothetical protein